MPPVTPKPITPRILLELALKAEVVGSLILEEEPDSIRAIIEESLAAGSDPSEVIPRLLLSAMRTQQLLIAAIVYAYPMAFDPQD